MHGVASWSTRSAPCLVGSEIDFVDALMGAGFAINNPNAGGLRLRLVLPGEGRGGRRAGRRPRRRRLRLGLLALSSSLI